MTAAPARALGAPPAIPHPSRSATIRRTSIRNGEHDQEHASTGQPSRGDRLATRRAGLTATADPRVPARHTRPARRGAPRHSERPPRAPPLATRTEGRHSRALRPDAPDDR
jgi:hypothetical protein